MDANLKPANAERVYRVTRADLPLHCPPDGSYLWNSHPKVFLPIESSGGWAMCPYCSAAYELVEDEADLPAAEAPVEPAAEEPR